MEDERHQKLGRKAFVGFGLAFIAVPLLCAILNILRGYELGRGTDNAVATVIGYVALAGFGLVPMGIFLILTAPRDDDGR